MDLPIVDTHMHLWDPGVLGYDWIKGNPILDQTYGLKEFGEHTESLNMERMVFLECGADSAMGELEWVTSLAEVDSRIQGIVPHAPIEQGAEALPYLTEAAANPLVKGVRRLIQGESDPAYCMRGDFVEGVQLLADLDLHFELCLKGDDQFKHAVELVAACPDVRFILDHVGKPFIKEVIMDPWSEHLRAMASLPNAWCKVSGMVTEADHEAWTAKDLRPYLDVVIEAFGWERIMFGGDWPVALLASSYERWAETLHSLVAEMGASDEQLAALFSRNAVDFYRLD